jgi:hypothetical protein
MTMPDLTGEYEMMTVSDEKGFSTDLVRSVGSKGEWFDKETGEPFLMRVNEGKMQAIKNGLK